MATSSISTESSETSPRDNSISHLAVGSGISLIGKILGRGSYIIGQILLARLFGPEVFGLYAIGLTIILLIDRFTPLGLDKGIIRFGSMHKRREISSLRGAILKSLTLSIIFGSLAGVGVYLAAPWIVKVYGKDEVRPILQGFALALPFMVGLKMAASATRVSQRMKYSALSQDIGQPMISVVLLAIFYWLGWGIMGAVYAHVLSYLIAFVIAMLFTQRLFPEVFKSRRMSGPGYRELLFFSIPTAFTGMLGALNLWAARLIVGYYRPESEVGIYQALSQISIIFAIILEAFNTIFAPMIADFYHNKKFVQLEEAYRVSTKWGLYLCLPLFLVILFAPQQILLVLFGKLYVEGAVPLIILTISQFINVGTGGVGFILIMTGRQKRWLVISASAVAVNLIFGITLIPRFGLIGAAIATSLSTVVLFLSGLIEAKRLLGLWPYDRRYIKGILALLAPLIILLVLPKNFSTPFISLIFITLIAHFGFIVALFLQGLEEEDKTFVISIFKKLNIKKASFFKETNVSSQ